MSNYAKASVPRPAGMPGNGIKTKDRIVIIDVDDIQTFPATGGDGVTKSGNLALTSDAKAVAIYATPGTVNIQSNSDGDADQEGFTPQVVFSHPGNKQAIRAFKTNWIGKRCIVIVDYCSGEPSDMIGSPCNPCRMQVNYNGTAEANTNEFTFKQTSKGDDTYIYTGTPVSVADDATEPAGKDESQSG